MYLTRLRNTYWRDEMPTQIHVVVAGDRGGDSGSNWTKIGLFVPTGVDLPQKSQNILVFAAFDGAESTENIEEGKIL